MTTDSLTPTATDPVDVKADVQAGTDGPDEQLIPVVTDADLPEKEVVGFDSNGDAITHDLDRGSTSSVPVGESESVLSRICHVCSQGFGDVVEFAAHLAQHPGQHPSVYELGQEAQAIIDRRQEYTDSLTAQNLESWKAANEGDMSHLDDPSFDARNVDPALRKLT